MRLREQGEAVHLVSKTHCSAQNLGLGAQTADHWVRRNVRGGSAQKLDWLVVEEITQLDMALWADLACVGLNADVKFLLLGDFRQLPAVLDSWAGRPISAPLEHSQLVRDLAGGHRHELTENMRSDPGIFDFVKWLRVGEEACPTLEQAKARLKELFPSKPGWPDTTLVISHSKRMAVNAAANRALAPEGSKLLELDVIHMGCHETVTQVLLPNCNTKQPAEHEGLAGAAPHRGRRKNSQGRLCGRGGSGAGRSEAGQRHAAEEPGAAAGHPAEPRSDLRQLPGAHPPQPRPPGPGVLPPHAAPPVRGRLAGHELRAAGSLERAARRLQGLQHEVAHLEEHAPLPAHQPHVPGLHKRAAGRGTRLPAESQKRQRSKSTLHFTCLPLALTLTARCSWLSSSVRVTPGR